MDWYPRNPSDYDRDTLGLSLAGHGAYTRLIDYYMQTEQPLPDDDRKLAAILRIGLDEWKNLAGSVRVFFTAKNGTLHQKRCDVELDRQRRFAENSRKNGRKGGRPKLNKNKDEKPTPNPTITQAIPQQATQQKPQTDRQTDRQEEKETLSGFQKENQEPEIIPPEKPNGQGKRGMRLPDDWAAEDAEISWALAEGADMFLIERETEKFKDYWRAKPGAGGVKLDWAATWRNWIRKALESQPRRHGGLTGYAAAAAGLERRQR